MVWLGWPKDWGLGRGRADRRLAVERTPWWPSPASQTKDLGLGWGWEVGAGEIGDQDH